jgi:two-component system, cell cycle sensor histidine kinase and response regulator CckA
MLQRLTVVAPRDNDALTLRRGHVLAQVLLMLMVIAVALGALGLRDQDTPAQITTVIGLIVMALVYAINRAGRVRLAMLILLIGGTCSTVVGAIISERPIPMLFFLGLIVAVAAAFGRPRTPIIWAVALSTVPLILNVSVYGTLTAPDQLIQMPDGYVLPSILTQELQALALLWMMAGTAYLSSRLLNQQLEESRAATEQALSSNQQLRRSEERFAKVFHRNPVGISITRLHNGRVIDINDSLLKLLGYRRDEVIGKTMLELSILAQNTDREQTVEMLREGHSIHDQELQIRTKSGDLREGLNAIELIELDGEICMLSMLYDITERKRIEAALRQFEERFVKVFRASPVGISISRLDDGRFIDVNDSFLQIVGYQREEVIGRTTSELNIWHHSVDRAEIIEMLRERGAVREQESLFRVRSGELRDGLSSIDLIELDGEICMLSMLIDITERKRTEAALRESEEQYRLIAEHSRDLIVLLDRGGRVLYASPSHQHVLGYAPVELIGRSAIDVVHPDDRALVLREWTTLAARGHIQTTVRVRHANGDWLSMETSSSILDKQGGTLNVARDVTERKRLEAQLLQSQKMETIGRLAGGIAHDFNNLLTAITGYADFALEDLPQDSAVRNDIEELRKSADRATSLTRQLLAFARKQMIEPRIVNLNQLVGDMGGFIRRLVGELIELSMLPAADLGSVRVDTNQIEQVIVNLVVNARDAMPQGGRLAIETANVVLDAGYADEHVDVKPGRYVMLTVGDTGVGMDAAVQEHLFEPFFTTKGPGKGTGLGLATCYGIVKQHGGYILPYSEPGRGTLMKIYLPRVDEPLDPLPDAEAYTNARGDETILLVEDEAAVRELAVRVLRGQGYTVLEAGDGLQALQLIAQEQAAQVDLLVTDVVMPGLGGGQLAERLIAMRPGIKVLFTSGYTQDAVLHAGQLAPGTHFLHKPFSPAALAHKVRGLLDS